MGKPWIPLGGLPKENHHLQELRAFYGAILQEVWMYNDNKGKDGNNYMPYWKMDK
jgi:hypothetical protein